MLHHSQVQWYDTAHVVQSCFRECVTQWRVCAQPLPSILNHVCVCVSSSNSEDLLRARGWDVQQPPGSIGVELLLVSTQSPNIHHPEDFLLRTRSQTHRQKTTHKYVNKAWLHTKICRLHKAGLILGRNVFSWERERERDRRDHPFYEEIVQ